MAGFLVVPSANAEDDLTGAVVDANATAPAVLSGLVNGTEYVAYRLSDPSPAFTPAVGAINAAMAATYSPALSAAITGSVGRIGSLAATYLPGHVATITGTVDGISFTSGTYTRTADGNAPTLNNTGIVANGTTGPYFLDLLTVTNGTTPSQTDMDNGSGTGVLEKITLGPQANIEDLDGALDLSVSITNGRIYQQYRDSGSDRSALTSTPVADAITYDAAAPVFSSAEIGTVDATSLIVTFDKNVFDPGSALAASDFDVQVAGSPATESAVAISADTVDITLSAAVTSGQAVTVAYNGTALVGADGEQVATFTAQSVTNNVSGGGSATLTRIISVDEIQFVSGAYTFTIPNGSVNANDELVFMISGNTMGTDTFATIEIESEGTQAFDAQLTNGSSLASGIVKVTISSAAATKAGGDFNATIRLSGTQNPYCALDVAKPSKSTTLQATATDGAGTTLDIDVNTSSDAFVFVAAEIEGGPFIGGGGSNSPVSNTIFNADDGTNGITERYYLGDGTESFPWHLMGYNVVTTGATPRNIAGTTTLASAVAVAASYS